MLRKFYVLFCLSLFVISAYAQKDYTVRFSQSASNNYQLKFSIDDWKLEKVTLDGNIYEKILFSQSTVTQDEGYAELPFISASVQLLPDKDVDLKIISTEYEDIILDYPLVPSRGIIFRNQDPTHIPYKIAQSAMVNQFYPQQLAAMEKPYIIRDIRGTSVRVFPFNWNAVTKTLRVYRNIEVELVENNNHPTNPLLKVNRTPVIESIGLYESLFLNFDKSRYDLTLAEHGDILVVTTARDEEAIEPYILWKREKGFNVFKEVVAKGTNAKTIIKESYNANNNLMYVLLVGDWDDILSDYETFWGLGSGPKDPMLGCVIGNDDFPDLAIGRFSANNPEHVTTQVNKTINYEKYPDMETDWYETFIGIGSNDSNVGDDSERDYTHIQRIYSQRLEPFGYTIHKENYAPRASLSNLIEHVNAGASTIAYCGHGDVTYFVTTGYSNQQVQASTNGSRLPFIVAVACLTGAFHYERGDCFGEAWLRKENGGALVSWMSSINQPWNPPQRGQDYFYDILTGGFDYDQYRDQSGISTSEQRTHWGSITVNTFGLMLTESSRTDDIMTVKTWTTFGDPAVQLRTKAPSVISSSNNEIILGTDYETTITLNGKPLKGALVCISQKGVYEKAVTDESGKVSIPNNFEAGEVLLVVTGFNTTTIYETMPCITPEGSYVLVDAVTVNDENQQLDYYDKSTKLNLKIKNIGNEDAGEVKVTITSDDPYVTIINNTATLPSILSKDNFTLEDAFEIAVSNNVPDQHIIKFTAVTEETEVRKSEFTLTANACKFTISDIRVNDVEGGMLSGNDQAIIKLKITNEGHAEAFSVKGKLSTKSPYIHIPTAASAKIGELAPGESQEITFFTTVSDLIPAGQTVDMSILFSGLHEISKTEVFNLSTLDYCKTGRTVCSGNDVFLSFILGDIVNTDETCTEDGYSDYTDMQTTLIPGQEYTVKAICGYNNERIRGWIDFNGNREFEEEESAFAFRGGDAGLEASETFTVPETAVPGIHRMRVRLRYAALINTPCDNSVLNGQTHDYTIIIPHTYPRVENLSAIWKDNNIKVSWDAPETTDNNLSLVGYTVTKNNILITESPIVDTFYNDEDIIEGGMYVYKITAVYEEGSSLPKLSDIVYIDSYEVPSGLAATTEGTTVNLTWTATEREALGYNIYRDGHIINKNLITDLTYSDKDLAADTQYCYTVTAEFETGESDMSEERCVTTGTNNIEEYSDHLQFELFPNPVTKTLYLSGNIKPKSIHIYSITGRLIEQINNCEKEMTIPVSQLSSGIYLLEIETDKGIVSRKIIKK